MPDLSSFDLSGRSAFVTGASRGIGRAIAEALARAGARVAVSARDAQSLEPTVAAIAAGGGTALPFALDVTDVAAIDRVTAEAVAALGGLDIFVANAGTEEVRPSLEVDEALFDRILDTNLKGAFFSVQAAAKAMRTQGRGGSIITLLSLTSEVGIPTAVPYGASKSGLLGMTRALAAEWAPLGIRVNGIAPGYFRTALTEVFYKNEAWAEAMIPKIPLGRFGRLDDLSGAAVFLASDASAYVTGILLPVDGGTLAAL